MTSMNPYFKVLQNLLAWVTAGVFFAGLAYFFQPRDAVDKLAVPVLIFLMFAAIGVVVSAYFAWQIRSASSKSRQAERK